MDFQSTETVYENFISQVQKLLIVYGDTNVSEQADMLLKRQEFENYKRWKNFVHTKVS